MEATVSDEIQKFLLGAVVVLTSAFITIRYQEYKRKKEAFDQEFKEFRLALTDLVEIIWDKNISIDTIILQCFKDHSKAKNRFIHNLKGAQRKKFYEKWDEYKNCYEFSKSLGSTVIVAAICPPNIDISKVTQKDIEVYDYERRKHIHVLLDELISIANKKIWY
jgi:hypothetical protein